MRMRFVLNSPGRPASPLRKLAGWTVMAVLAVLALIFSGVVFATVMVAGAIAWVYLWWKTRELRRMMRDFPPCEMQREPATSNDAVFEGEVIRVVESRSRG